PAMVALPAHVAEADFCETPAAEPALSVRQQVRARLLAHGYNSNDFLALYRGWRYFLHERGIVVYQRRGRTLVASGDPLCAEAALGPVLAAFVAFARGQRCRAAFLGASERLAAVAATRGFGVLKVGEEPFFELASYAPSGDRAKKARSALNQARRRGVTVRPYCPAEGGQPELEREAG